jgi:predicted dehydrogenase
MNIVIIGTGMYVSGRGTDGYGTILPAIIEWKRKGRDLDSVFLAGTNKKRSSESLEKAQALQEISGVPINISTFPNKVDSDQNAYKKVIEQIELPACAIIAVPDHIHYKVTKDCLDAGLHTLVAKPLTPTIKEAEKLIKLANEKPLYGAVEFHKRWDKQNLMLRDSLRDGRIGEPLYCWVEYSQPKTMPEKFFRSWVENTNPLQYLGVHYIDIVRFVTGAEPVRVMAVGQKNWLIRKGLNVYDSIQCMVEWRSNGFMFNQTLLVNWIDPQTTSAISDQKIKFVGTEGRFESDQKDRGIRILADGKNMEEPNPDFCHSYGLTEGHLAWKGYGIDSITTFLDDVSDIFNGKSTPLDLESKRPSFSEALVSTSVVQAANKSLLTDNSWYKVDTTSF